MWIKIFDFVFGFVLSSIKNPEKKAQYKDVLLVVAGTVVNEYSLQEVADKAEQLKALGR